MRSTLKLNAAISDEQIGGLRSMLAEDQKWGGPGSIIPNMLFLAINLWFRSRRAALLDGKATVKRVDFTGINRLAVRLQKLHFMKSLFSQNSKVEKLKIQILVGISIFVEDSKSLLPTLGRSANLSKPWAPRKDTIRSFVHFYYLLKTYFAISKVDKIKSIY